MKTLKLEMIVNIDGHDVEVKFDKSWSSLILKNGNRSYETFGVYNLDVSSIANSVCNFINRLKYEDAKRQALTAIRLADEQLCQSVHNYHRLDETLVDVIDKLNKLREV